MSFFIEKSIEYYGKLNYNIHSISEYFDDKIENKIFVEGSRCKNVYSISKTFTAVGIGLLYDKGLLTLDSKICDILSDYLPDCEIDKRWHDVTIEMALRHRLGLPCGFLDIDCLDPLNFTENYLHYTFKQNLVFDPGKGFNYSDGAYYLLSCVVEKLSGMSLENFLWKEMLFHMDVKEIAWSHCPAGHCMGGTGLYISAEDVVRLGALYLNNGVYNNKQLLSEEWINLSAEKALGFDYGKKDDYCIKGGMYGQKLFISFKQNRAVAVESFDEGDDDFVKFMKTFD